MRKEWYIFKVNIIDFFYYFGVEILKKKNMVLGVRGRYGVEGNDGDFCWGLDGECE